MDGVDVIIIRSKRRRRTVSARAVAGAIEVRAPARTSRRELSPIIERLVRRISKNQLKRDLTASDEGLHARATVLALQYFRVTPLPPYSITWSTRMSRRFGSCTPETGAIRISSRLKKLPEWVVDYVIVHELAHLIRPDHSPHFWKLVEAYPKWEAARAFLAGYQTGIEES